MKKILLPTDFSDNAWNAIFTVLKMYENVPCHFYIMHAYEPQPLNLLGKKGEARLGVIYDSLAKHSEQELGQISGYLKERHLNANHKFETLSKSNDLVSAVKEVLSEKGIDLIVMGTQGATGAKEVFLGSNTVKVLKQIKHCPILAVPESYNFQTLKTLVFPTDFTRIYEKHELLPIIELTKLWKSEIQVTYVALEFVLSDRQKANKKLLNEHFKDLEHTYQEVDMESNVYHTIEKYASKTEADLLALIQYQHTFWEKVIDEPTVKKVVFHTKIPVMVIPE